MDFSELLKDIGFTTALLTAFVTVGLFIFKEWIENKRERKKDEKKRVDEFRAYTDPLLRAGYDLYQRLQEIFDQKAKFLWERAPKNHFNQYRYISTLYRLCVVLGWVRALRLELAGMELHDSSQYKKIDTSIREFQRMLYESHLMEGARISFLARIWKININDLPSEDLHRMEENIAQLIWETLAEKNTVYAKGLDEETQLILLRKIAKMMYEDCEHEPIDEKLLLASADASIRSISRTESWIYLDWQYAIGDIMLDEADGINTLRKLKVIGFETFEDMYLEYVASKRDEKVNLKNRWIGRIDKLFLDLRVETSEAVKKYDARIQQLRNVGSALLQLIDALETIKQEEPYHRPHDLKDYFDYDKTESNPKYYLENDHGSTPSV
jgi:hypothetical protein